MDQIVSHLSLWNRWNESGGPKYPHEKLVQFCFRNYSREVRRTARALDLGCGCGVHTAFLAREGFSVAACDISSIGVERTLQRLRSENLTARVIEASIASDVFDGETFDLIVCIGVLEAAGLATAKETALRLPKLLAPGGRAFFLFAGEQDFRLEGENSFMLKGFTRDEVVSVFASSAENCWIDEYTTTYENKKYQQFEWLVTTWRPDKPLA